MTFDDFINKFNGKFVEVAGSVGAEDQCVDLANEYFRSVLGVPIVEWTNAKDFPSKVSDLDFTWVKNDPTAIPKKGDVMIWGGTTWGHISIFYEGNVNNFVSFDQNWPTGSPCHLEGHDYYNVLGWLHPINNTMSNTIQIAKSVFERLVKNSTQWDEVVENLIPEADSNKTTAEQLKSVVAGLKSRATDMENRATKAETELANRVEQVGRLKEESAKLTKLLNTTELRIKNMVGEQAKITKAYKDQLIDKQGVVDDYAKRLGTANLEIAELKLKREYTVLLKIGLLKLILEKK